MNAKITLKQKQKQKLINLKINEEEMKNGKINIIQDNIL